MAKRLLFRVFGAKNWILGSPKMICFHLKMRKVVPGRREIWLVEQLQANSKGFVSRTWTLGRASRGQFLWFRSNSFYLEFFGIPRHWLWRHALSACRLIAPGPGHCGNCTPKICGSVKFEMQRPFPAGAAPARPRESRTLRATAASWKQGVLAWWQISVVYFYHKV